MFERYTEGARRVIFRARHEAAEQGSPYIETEHLLAGLLDTDSELAARLLDSKIVSAVRAQLRPTQPKTKTRPQQVDLPLSHECQRAMAYAAEESLGLKHWYIGTEHLLLGLLREERCRAAFALCAQGIELGRLRERIAGPRLVVTTAGQRITKQGLHQLIDELPEALYDSAGDLLRELLDGGNKIA
jgi:ATP-dependent Clp protease ATP-binding subunit ClpC